MNGPVHSSLLFSTMKAIRRPHLQAFRPNKNLRAAAWKSELLDAGIVFHGLPLLLRLG